MLYAINANGKKISAKHDVIGYCPECLNILVPRCGRRKIWHWSHKGTHKKYTKNKSLFDF